LKRPENHFKRLKKNLSFFIRGYLSRGTDALEAEVKEMESAFCIILLGALVGMPSPPSFIGIKMLPFMEWEIMVMISRSGPSDDRMAEWFGILDFG